MESLKVILASRPVVYLGFGLKDPDFLFLRDVLANTYKGGTRDHYCVMADISEEEHDYWRKNYGIHLISYPTTTLPNQAKDHTALLTLLDTLLQSTPESSKEKPDDLDGNSCPPELVLSLARHAARLTRTAKVNPEFSIRVHANPTSKPKRGHYYLSDKFDHCPIEMFLDDGPERAILVGLPGAGKTYSLNRYAARLAEKLYELCLEESFDRTAIVVPILVDLKHYRGKLEELVEKALPSNMPLEKISEYFNIKVLLDSFNEMPREYIESGSYETDFMEFTEKIKCSSIIICSRTNDGLERLGFPTYNLDQIDKTIVANKLQELAIDTDNHLGNEVCLLLQKPFFFQLFTSGAVSLPQDAHPKDIYSSLFENLQSAFTLRFGKELEVEKALSLVAYSAINCGEEAYPLSDLLRILKTSIEEADLFDVTAGDIANWLISSSILVPHIGGRIAFVHQSITEYLAAKELAQRYQVTPNILMEKLTLTRWDQSLFLTLSLLPSVHTESFFKDIVRADFELALNAVKYLEIGRDDVVAKLLSLIPESLKYQSPHHNRISYLLESQLPLTESHEPLLRSVMKLGSSIGGAAANRLIQIKGDAVKDEMINEMVHARSDYNYCCNGIARALQNFITPEDIQKIVDLADSISSEVTAASDEHVASGFISGAAQVLSSLDISLIRDVFLPSRETSKLSEILARILFHILWDKKSTEALELAGELLLESFSKAATAIYFIASGSNFKTPLSWDSFNEEHIDRLVSIVETPKEDSWALKAIHLICLERSDLLDYIKTVASSKPLLTKAFLLSCVETATTSKFPIALEGLLHHDSEERSSEPIHLLDEIDINWNGHEELLVQLLKLRDTRLALAIVESIYTADEDTEFLGQLEIGSIEWWLDWLKEEADLEGNNWFLDRMPWLLSSFISKDKRHSFVIEFNKPDSEYREIIANYILHHHSDLTTDDFSSDAISYLLATLDKFAWHPFNEHLLGSTATEQFVSEQLLPLLSKASGHLLTNLHKILQQAGSRHGRRYGL